MWKANLKSGTISSFLGRRKSSSATSTSTSSSIPSSSQAENVTTAESTSEEKNDLKISGDFSESEEKNEEEAKEDIIKNNKIKSELSALPKVGNPAAHKKGEKHGLTPLQVDRKIQELTECIRKGKAPSKCKSCKQTKAYMYHSFSKRGGTKKLYCCANCFDHWSDFYCAEEDYDFLSG
jgi:hypothetical protein